MDSLSKFPEFMDKNCLLIFNYRKNMSNNFFRRINNAEQKTLTLQMQAASLYM